MTAEAPLWRGVRVEFDVPARMRDGVSLRANVYRPEGSGPWPTLLTRTPYDKNDLHQNAWSGIDPVQTARRGFMVVIQDVRGRFSSEGQWDPFRFERLDGYDTVEWAARLPGSNGRVGMYSGSYCASTQWLAAAERPPSLAAIAPALTWSDPMDGLFARGGAVEIGLALRWALENGFDSLRRRGLDDHELQRCLHAVIDEWNRLSEKGYWHLPVSQMPAFRRHGLPDLGAVRVLEHPEIATRCRVSDLYERIAVPSFHTAGWYDTFLQGTLDNHRAMSAAGRDARLIVGPWSHESFADPIGDRLFGLQASRDQATADGKPSWSDLQLRWLHGQLEQGDGKGQTPGPAVRIFVMGRDEWREEPCWPPPRTRLERWFLLSDGSLARTAPEAGHGASEFVYDPSDPVPTSGGHGVLSLGYATGPVDQTSVEERRDVLVFTSEPVEHELEIAGRVRVVLHAQSSARSTDWVARLCDVRPDGRSFNLCDGIVRAFSGANECAVYEIDLWSTCNVFLRGHRLRVHVTSSSFPRWDRNLNTGDQSGTRIETALQRVHHDQSRPSFVELPVIGGT
jgi:hypothetical protein